MLPHPHASTTRETETPADAAPAKAVSPKAERTPTSADLAAHMHLVHKVVAHFVRRLPSSVQREDLVAAGTLGLFFALRASNHSCDEMFASYARIRIRGSIVDELRRHDWSPRRRRSEAKVEPVAPSSATFRTSTDLAANDTTRTTEPASNVLSLDAARARSAAVTVRRLPTPDPVPKDAGTEGAPLRVAVVGFDDLPPHQMQLALGELDGELHGSPLDEVEDKRRAEGLHAAVALLPPRERSIIRMRYFDAMPSKAIASALGLSEARISQLHARATARLKELLANGEQVELAA